MSDLAKLSTQISKCSGLPKYKFIIQVKLVRAASRNIDLRVVNQRIPVLKKETRCP